MKRIPSLIGLVLLFTIQLGCSKAPVLDYTVHLPGNATDVMTERVQQGIDYSIYLKATVSPEGFKLFCDHLDLSIEPNTRRQSKFADESIRAWWIISKKDGIDEVSHHYYTRNIYREDDPESITDTLAAFYYNGNLYFQHTNF